MSDAPIVIGFDGGEDREATALLRALFDKYEVVAWFPGGGSWDLHRSRRFYGPKGSGPSPLAEGGDS